MTKKKKIKNRMRKADDTSSSRIGVAWYRREQWERLLEISSDREELEDTYDEWLAMAERRMKELARHGYMLRKVDIDVEELVSWCNSQNRPVDGTARTEFVILKLREQDEAYQ